ncbi:hypothetical protein AB1K54_02220 [Microbacterium sp. BWT-B31]|uniref:hypothetical protein n=1 Tax=Microbacterium sp. BWT-B31 TaxID=3232072 RepID=UPI0035278E8D
MSERMRRPGAPERPKEGIYLDAALAVVGEQLDERIDELSRRRRMGARAGIAALSVLAVASGSVAAAVALSAAPATPAQQAALTAEHVLRCVEDDGTGRDAYFTLRYRTGVGDASADEVRVCASAWSALERDQAMLVAATPDRLVQIAEGFVAAALVVDDESGNPAPQVAVTDASFGRLSGSGGMPIMLACAGEAASVVVAVRDRDLTSAEQALACERAAS